MTTRQRETTQQVCLTLECECGAIQRYWVHPDAKLMHVAKAHGWRWEAGWVCPECRRKSNDELAGTAQG